MGEVREKHIDHDCPVCGWHGFEVQDSWDFCPVCGWEDSVLQIICPDEDTPNGMTLEEARKRWANGEKVWDGKKK